MNTSNHLQARDVNPSAESFSISAGQSDVQGSPARVNELSLQSNTKLVPSRVSTNAPLKSESLFVSIRNFFHRHFGFLTDTQKSELKSIKTEMDTLNNIILELKDQAKKNKNFTEKLRWKLPTQKTKTENAQRLEKAEYTLKLAEAYLTQLTNRQSSVNALAKEFDRYASLPSEIAALQKKVQHQQTELAIAKSFNEMEGVLLDYDANKTWEQFQTVREGTTHFIKSIGENLGRKESLSFNEAAALIKRTHPDLLSKLDLLHANLMTVEQGRLSALKAKTGRLNKLVDTFRKKAHVISSLESKVYQKATEENKLNLENAENELKDIQQQINLEGPFLTDEVQWLHQIAMQHSHVKELHEEVMRVEIFLERIEVRDEISEKLNILKDALDRYKIIKDLTERMKNLKNNSQSKLSVEANQEMAELKQQIASQTGELTKRLYVTLRQYVDPRSQIKHFDKLSPLEQFHALVKESYKQLGVRSKFIVESIKAQGLENEVVDSLKKISTLTTPKQEEYLEIIKIPSYSQSEVSLAAATAQPNVITQNPPASPRIDPKTDSAKAQTLSLDETQNDPLPQVTTNIPPPPPLPPPPVPRSVPLTRPIHSQQSNLQAQTQSPPDLQPVDSTAHPTMPNQTGDIGRILFNKLGNIRQVVDSDSDSDLNENLTTGDDW